MRIKKEYSLSILFLMMSVLLLVLMLFQYGYGKNYRSQILEKLENNGSAGFSMQEIPDYKFTKKTLKDYPDIVERPLFFKVRRPVIPPLPFEEEAKIPIISKNYKFILTGIIKTPDETYCLLQNTKSKQKEEKFFRLKEGEEIDGKFIQEIKSDRVVMVTDGVSEELLLMKPRSKRTIPPKKQTKPRVRKPVRNSKDRLKTYKDKSKKKYLIPPEANRNTGSERLNPFNTGSERLNPFNLEKQ